MDLKNFKENIRTFLVNLSDDPRNIVIDDPQFINRYNITPQKLLAILLDRGVVQQVDDYEFVIPSNKYERKLNRLHVLMSSRQPKIDTIVEDEGINGGATTAGAVNGSAPIGKLSVIKK